MSYHIYHTRGIILGSVPVGESNRFYKIFTEELGLVGATAQSVREGKSKLRYTLQDLSFASVDLVRGKEVWRVTSAGEWRAFPVIKGDALRLKLFARACSLVSRLLQGEGREQELFADIVGMADFLESCATPEHPLSNLGVSFPSTLGNETPKLLAALEVLVALRVLVRLGYLDPEGYEKFLEPGAYSREILEEFEVVRVKALPKINEALRSSHL
ncbi:MAG: DNA repair protein RecO [Patescibacteria group bacterium]